MSGLSSQRKKREADAPHPRRLPATAGNRRRGARSALALAVFLCRLFLSLRWPTVSAPLRSWDGGASGGGGVLRNSGAAGASEAAMVAGADADADERRAVTKVAEGDSAGITRSDDPWYGWCPPISEVMECLWRDCFKKDHGCGTCRDGIDDLGPAPSVPDGWVPDVTSLRRMVLNGSDADGNPWPPPLDRELCEPIGVNGGQTDPNKPLLDAVPIVAQPMDKGRGGWSVAAVNLTNGKAYSEAYQQLGREPRIMCLLYTMESAHHTTIRAIRETWAGGCDGFLAFSTASDPRIPAISIPHDGPEEYGNMWQKVRSIWRFIADHYLDQFDFFFVGGDDLFVIPQNLREYLGTVGDPEGEHFVGRRFKKSNTYFNSGGAGYALSRGTLWKFRSHMDDSKCNPTRKTSMEDVMIAQCLSSLGIGLTDTRDKDGRERFHPFPPGKHYTWKPPGPKASDWYESYNKEWGIKLGKDCCAPDSVSFHYLKKPEMVRHIYSLLYLCKGEGQ